MAISMKDVGNVRPSGPVSYYSGQNTGMTQGGGVVKSIPSSKGTTAFSKGVVSPSYWKSPPVPSHDYSKEATSIKSAAGFGTGIGFTGLNQLPLGIATHWPWLIPEQIRERGVDAINRKIDENTIQGMSQWLPHNRDFFPDWDPDRTNQQGKSGEDPFLQGIHDLVGGLSTVISGIGSNVQNIINPQQPQGQSAYGGLYLGDMIRLQQMMERDKKFDSKKGYYNKKKRYQKGYSKSGRSKAFYSRKFKKWFKSYGSFLKYNKMKGSGKYDN